MSGQSEIPARFSIRHIRDEGWQVLVKEGDFVEWVACETQDDAEAISETPELFFCVGPDTPVDAALVDRLERAAEACRRYLPRSIIHRRLAARAREARERLD